MPIIRRETADDVAAVAAVTGAAFEGDVEQRLLEQLRPTDAWLPRLSLVAEHDGRLAGHVLCTRAHLGGAPALGLGPLSVHPDLQRRGLGSALVHAVLAAADALDEPVVVLLGDPGYYARFGFRLAAEYRITPPIAEWAPHFQARPLTAWSADLQGEFVYAASFMDA